MPMPGALLSPATEVCRGSTAMVMWTGSRAATGASDGEPEPFVPTLRVGIKWRGSAADAPVAAPRSTTASTTIAGVPERTFAKFTFFKLDPAWQRRYPFVYPFEKKPEWYRLPADERQRIMSDHIEVGRRYPEIAINTAYSFGLDDQEFVVSFEADDPGQFLDLVQELRGTESSSYTLRDTPIFTCVSMSVARALDALDGAATARSAPALA